ncbi:MAG: hypothetical protein HXX11_17435 [Desulfuromonadales bacterium]|nr:hypothetical protein [Desulfuromonadales bacterium]
MSTTEMIFNLWAIHDPDDKVVYGLAGRAYYACGTDEEKMALLKQFAVSDFVLATRMPVPERFSVESEGEALSGFCPLSELYNPETTLFQEMLQELEGEIAYRYTSDSGGEGEVPEVLKVPVNPLFLITALVEDKNGFIRALVGD